MRTLTNPYPAEWQDLSDFTYLSALRLVRPVNRVRDRIGTNNNYILDRDFDVAISIDGERRVITAPRGLVTDLTSVPEPFRIFIGRVGPWLEAAIVHDWLYVAWQVVDASASARNRLFADRVMLLAMRAAEVGVVRRWAIYLALRAFGTRGFERREEPVFADLKDPAMETPMVIPVS